MFDSIKRLTKHSAVYGVGHIITRAVNFLLLPLYTHKLSTDEFGVSAVLFTFLALMTILYTFGLDAAFLRFFILSTEPQKRQQIFSTAFWSVVVIASAFTAVICIFAPAISVLLISKSFYAEVIRLVGLILLFDALAFLPFLYLRAEEKSIKYILLKFINVLINIALNIYYIVYLNRGVEGIFLANLGASVITFLLLLPILFRQISMSFVNAEFRELINFGLPYLPSAFAVVILETSDRLILGKLVGLDVAGVYSAGHKLGIFMSLIVAAFRFAWHPFFLSTSKEDNAKAVFSKVFTYFTLFAAGVFLVISFFIDELVRLQIFGVSFFGKEYWASTKVVPIILLSYIIYGMYVNFMVGIYLEKKTKYLPAVTGAGALVNVLANITLIPLFGMMGSAYASLIGYLVMAGLLYIFAQKYYTIPYEFSRLLKLALAAAAIFAFGYYIKGSWMVMVKCLLIVGFPLLLWVMGFFERRELHALRRLVSDKLGSQSSA
jgi:O-antigen/teichoic acid export membrane protein